jgi:organic hydroperoxide reductase OsmC/OhrA
MQPFPHRYTVTASSSGAGDVDLTAAGLPTLQSASPAEFDGPGDRWSPETFLTGALADCFILTFRTVARASKLPWTSLRCEATGTLDRVDRVTQFTGFELRAHLVVPVEADIDLSRRSLEKAERSCLISRSLNADIRLVPELEVASEPVLA